MTSCHGANSTLTLAQLAASNEQHGLQEVGRHFDNRDYSTKVVFSTGLALGQQTGRLFMYPW